tara:strand:- start:4223 stop:4594 length:372 start_codon:yes stop_codon:yes gene_type:complete
MATLSSILTSTRATQITTKLQTILDRYNAKQSSERWFIKIGGADDHGCDVQIYANEDGSVSVSLDEYGIVGCLIAESVAIYNDGDVVECEGVGDALVKMLSKANQKKADAQPWSSTSWNICFN